MVVSSYYKSLKGASVSVLIQIASNKLCRVYEEYATRARVSNAKSKSGKRDREILYARHCSYLGMRINSNFH